VIFSPLGAECSAGRPTFYSTPIPPRRRHALGYPPIPPSAGPQWTSSLHAGTKASIFLFLLPPPNNTTKHPPNPHFKHPPPPKGVACCFFQQQPPPKKTNPQQTHTLGGGCFVLVGYLFLGVFGGFFLCCCDFFYAFSLSPAFPFFSRF